ncbi:hypothetical protein HYH03_005725 [Edaphochlamys debaryana]|uniref:Plastid lipid-associated protein/fibrillin conserved domain-containing protein n=1 Tax=Edaphochlamys debaryana TaxID=47281 RepID=A0A836C1R1_9CHLO|nr:hypothetical protein HYH03_005725 [Edaphochlamys debaryana]|eukprot:KAG2496122.1 hypothetical protein HYH03_005725 [Edaphochlamys debaryana]
MRGTALQQRGARCLGASPRALVRSRTALTRPASAAASYAPADQASTSDRNDAKHNLLDLVANVNRGLRAGTYQRGLIEEAQVAVEGFQGKELDYSKLAGKWRLIYTTANDVLPILEAEFRLGFGPLQSLFNLPRALEVGGIFQSFSSPEEGVVENIIEFSTPAGSCVFTVGARYEVLSGKRISLVFEEARVGDLNPSDAAEALLAPALLPRGSLQHRLLLGIREWNARFQFRTAAQLASQIATARTSAAAGYLLSYLDEDMLIGRAVGLGGSFVFTREPEHSSAHEH